MRTPVLVLLLIALVALVSPLAAEVNTFSNGTSVTSTAAAISLGSGKATVWIKNDAASANELYFRLFHCGDTPADATTSSMRLEPGEAFTFDYTETTGTGGYCAISHVTAAAETATLRYIAK